MIVQTGKFLPELIAPCGMDCAICKAFFGYTMKDEKRKHQCNGCRSRKNPCAFIKQHCDLLKNMKIMYCFECTDFPCHRLSALDKRYRQKYRMSMIDNLKNIKANGMEHFLKSEEERWKCPKCGGIVCVHDGKCYSCERTPAPRGPHYL